MLVLDRGMPWVYGPVEHDPGMTERGMVLPRPVIRRLTELAALQLPFQRLVRALNPSLVWLAHAHEPWRPSTV